MNLYQLLNIQPGLTAVIGSGGKTSLINHLTQELRADGHTVVLTTTTHIRRPTRISFAADKEYAKELLSRQGVVCVGTNAGEGRLTAPSFEGWQTMADYVLVEADGSRMMPLKAHAPHEPVIPPEANQTVCVVGMSGFNAPIVQVVHRPEFFCMITGASILEMATPALVAQVVAQENLCSRVYLNQADLLEESSWMDKAKTFAADVKVPVIAGSLVNREWRMIK